MPTRLRFSFLLAVLVQSTAAASAHDAAQVADDARRHRAMAAAHEAAARCLESGTPHAQCQRELQMACKSLAIGKYCGMRHDH